MMEKPDDICLLQTETFSPHQLIYEKLTKENTLTALTALATAVSEKVKSRITPFG